MRVLLVHQYYRKLRGAFSVLLRVESTLRALGHETSVFASRVEDGEPSAYERYFPSGFDRAAFAGASFLLKGQMAVKGLYSLEARARLSQMLDEVRPDAAIVFRPEYQLSPSVLSELAARDLPFALWVVDYRFWCVNGLFFNRRTASMCTLCARGAHWRSLPYLCGEGSPFLTAYGATARLLAHTALRLHRLPKVLVVPSVRTQEILTSAAGIPKERFLVVRHPMDFEELRFGGEPAVENHAVFLGQLATEKGVWMLLEAMARTEGLRLEMYGIDSIGIADEVRKTIARLGLSGRVTLDTETRFGPFLKDRIRSAFCVAVPSIWPDTVDYTPLEGMALGKAVIVGDLGGAARCVGDAGGGIAVRAGDPTALAEALRRLSSDKAEAAAMGRRGRQYVLDEFSPARFESSLSALLERIRS